MPPKSTFFTPKLRTGFVLRDALSDAALDGPRSWPSVGVPRDLPRVDRGLRARQAVSTGATSRPAMRRHDLLGDDLGARLRRPTGAEESAPHAAERPRRRRRPPSALADAGGSNQVTGTDCGAGAVACRDVELGEHAARTAGPATGGSAPACRAARRGFMRTWIPLRVAAPGGRARVIDRGTSVRGTVVRGARPGPDAADLVRRVGTALHGERCRQLRRRTGLGGIPAGGRQRSRPERELTRCARSARVMPAPSVRRTHAAHGQIVRLLTHGASAAATVVPEHVGPAGPRSFDRHLAP